MRQSLKDSEREQAATDLHAILKPGDRVYCILRHRSRSGMQRVIDLAVVQDGSIRTIGYLAARLLGRRWDRDRGGVVVGGCGFDAGLELVHAMSWGLWRDTAAGLRHEWL